MWLVQMPSLLEPHEQAELQRQLAGTTRERMLREMAVFLEELTVEQPLLLVLEDLHWSDQATVELLAYLARRRDAARLLVLGVYRVGALSPNGHPLLGFTAELQVHGQCAELRLERLSEAEIDEYLGRRFPASVLPTQLAQVLHQRTEGNPLFLVNVVEDLIAQGCLREVEGSWGLYSGLEVIQERIPENLRQFVAQQGTRLSAEEQQTLEAASIAGTEFSAAAVAAALATDTEAVEVHCERLTQRQQFL
jgi:predicted ATPase